MRLSVIPLLLLVSCAPLTRRAPVPPPPPWSIDIAQQARIERAEAALVEKQNAERILLECRSRDLPCTFEIKWYNAAIRAFDEAVIAVLRHGQE